MGSKATIPLLPVPPRRRLSLLWLMLEMVRNPLGSWAEDFYDELVILYRNFGLEIAFVMDPELIQTIMLDDYESFSKRPIYDHVLGEGGGEGLLIAEGDLWLLAAAAHGFSFPCRGPVRLCAGFRRRLRRAARALA
jgi:hypothetical protein